MPTTQPRYTVTDTGPLRETLDLAQRRWPELRDRRQLLLALVGAGRDAVAAELDQAAKQHRRQRQREALGRARELIDGDALAGDAAWR